MLPKFLTYLSQSDYGKAYFLSVAHRTTNLACINKTKLEAFPVLLPPLEEQQKIVTVLEQADLAFKENTSEVDSVRSLFESLLHDLMTGKVRIPEFAKPEQGGSL